MGGVGDAKHAGMVFAGTFVAPYTLRAVHLDEVQRSRCRPRPASTTAARSLPRRTGRAAAGLISRSSSIGQDLRGDLPWLPGLVALFGQGRPGSDLWSAELTVSIFALSETLEGRLPILRRVPPLSSADSRLGLRLLLLLLHWFSGWMGVPRDWSAWRADGPMETSGGGGGALSTTRD